MATSIPPRKDKRNSEGISFYFAFLFTRPSFEYSEHPCWVGLCPPCYVLGLGDSHPREEDGRGLGRQQKFEREWKPSANTWEFVLGAAKSGEETWAKLCYLNTGFFSVKPNPRNEPSLDPAVYAVCTGRKHTGRLPIHILLSILGFGRSINFLYIFCSKFPTADVFTWFPKTAPSVWFYLERTSKTCRPWKLISLFWLFLGGISTVGFGMGVCDGTKYQAKLAYYESACFTHNFFFFFFPQQGLKLRNICIYQNSWYVLK